MEMFEICCRMCPAAAHNPPSGGDSAEKMTLALSFSFFFVHAISNWRTYARFEQTVKKRASVIGVEKFAAVMVAV